MAVSVGAALLAIIFAVRSFRNYSNEIAKEESGFGKILYNKWYIDELYDAIIVKPLLKLSSFLSNIVERKGIDAIVNGVGKAVNYGSRQIRLLQSGQVGVYILLMVVGMLALFIIQFFFAK